MQNVEFDSGAAGEADQVLVDESGDIVAIYEVKSSKQKSIKAKCQMAILNDNINNTNINFIYSSELNVDDFLENAGYWYRTIGPNDSSDFDEIFDYSEDEIEAF